jgi:hypothetical protein
MFKSDPLDQGRIDLYLNILVSENKKKVEFKQKEAIATIGSESTLAFIKIATKSSALASNLQPSANLNFRKNCQKISQTLTHRTFNSKPMPSLYSCEKYQV